MASTPPKFFAVLTGLLLTVGAGLAAAQQDAESERWVETGSDAQIRKTRGVNVNKNGYFKDRERGYFFYEDDPEEARRRLEEQQTAAAQPAKPTEKAHEPLSVAWLKEKLPEVRNAAIDNPTRENVEYYVYLQKIAMDKAEKFALMSQQVTLVNPDLDESVDNPTTTFARQARVRATDREQARVLRDLAGKVGIYYFFKSDCQYCSKQNITLNTTMRDYGFRIMPISIDHQGFPDGSFPNWVPDRGQAAKLKISVTPTLYLFHPPNEVVFLAAGLQTEGQLQKRILQVSQANGWLSKEELERAMRGLPRDFLVDAVKDLGEVDWTDTKSALDALRHASRRGLEKAKASDLLLGGAGEQPTAQGTQLTP
jgi:conjugal transfer pilus assembly protein TraF